MTNITNISTISKIVHISHIIPSISKEARNNVEAVMKKELPYLEFSGFDSVPEIFSTLSNPRFCTDYILIDIEHLYSIEGAEAFDLINTLKTLISCTVTRPKVGKPIKRTTKLIALVGGDTDPKLVRCMIKMFDGVGIRHSGGWTIEDVKADIRKISGGDLSLPKLVKDLLNNNRHRNSTEENNNLTIRQQQIYDLVVNRGISNKVIAKTLNISESTVKLHLGIVFKKFRVRNRTQLAAFSKTHSEV